MKAWPLSIKGFWRAWRDVPVRSLTITYLFALSLIAILMGLSHYQLDLTVEQQQDSATVVNVAGRQRMLSQRSALLAQDLNLGDETARAPLIETVDELERAQDALIKRNDLGITSSLSQAAADLYFKGRQPLDSLVRTYIWDLRQFIAMPPGAERNAAHAVLHKIALSSLVDELHAATLIFTNETNQANLDILRQQRLVLGVLLLTLAAEALGIFRPMVLRISAFTEKLRVEAAYDVLTGLLSRRHFFDLSDRMVLLARRGGESCSTLLLDIDKFKTINDRHGHAAGDLVLQDLARLLKTTLRRSDLIGRIGGEEFAILLPKTSAEAATALAEKLRRAVEQENCEKKMAFTVSVGVAELSMGDLDTKDLLYRADRALYFAKEHGRNRTAFLRSAEPEPELISMPPSVAIAHRRAETEINSKPVFYGSKALR